MPLSDAMLPSRCDVYRPFGSASPTTTGIPCRIAPRTDSKSRGIVDETIAWTHMLDFQPGVDIRDGCSRSAGDCVITYADGDEIRVPSGSTTRYVVMWVETIGRDTPLQFQRAYLLRHGAAWPDP